MQEVSTTRPRPAWIELPTPSPAPWMTYPACLLPAGVRRLSSSTDADRRSSGPPVFVCLCTDYHARLADAIAGGASTTQSDRGGVAGRRRMRPIAVATLRKWLGTPNGDRTARTLNTGCELPSAMWVRLVRSTGRDVHARHDRLDQHHPITVIGRATNLLQFAVVFRPEIRWSVHRRGGNVGPSPLDNVHCKCASSPLNRPLDGVSPSLLTKTMTGDSPSREKRAALPVSCAALRRSAARFCFRFCKGPRRAWPAACIRLSPQRGWPD